MSSLFGVALQCCDAGSYIGFGSECATTGICHGDLRPMGVYYWFSIPERLGIPIESLIAANFFLMACSVLLSVLAIRKMIMKTFPGSLLRKSDVVLLGSLSLIVHAIYLWPTIRHTLSDPPANLMLLSGLWLLMLNGFSAEHRLIHAVNYLIAGILLGLAVWLRAFYLYPVVFGMCLYFCMWILSKKRKMPELFLLVVFIPVFIQYATIYREYGEFGFLEPKTQKTWSNMHLYQPYVGYDTVFPNEGYIWQPRHCHATVGIFRALDNRSYQQLSCLVLERLFFYLGTYNTETYIFSDKKNLFFANYAESVGSRATDWFTWDMDFEENSALAPSGEKTADKLSFQNPVPGGKGDVIMWLPLRGNTAYTFSIWLWSPMKKTINLAIKSREYDRLVAIKQVTLTPYPTRHYVTGTTQQAAYYDVDIGRTPYADASISLGEEVGDFFYAWGAQLEEGPNMTDYNTSGISTPDSIRKWRPELLALNILVLILVAAEIIKARKFWLQERMGAVVMTIVFSSFFQSLAIIPEQRFAIGFMIFFWIIALGFLLAPIKKIAAWFLKADQRKVN